MPSAQWPTVYTGSALLADPQDVHAVSTMHNSLGFHYATTYRLLDSAWLFDRTSLDASRVGETVTVAMLREICASSTSETVSGQCDSNGQLTEAKLLDTSAYRYFDAYPGPLTRITELYPDLHTFTTYRLLDSAWLFARTSLDASRVGETVTVSMLQEICSSSTSGTLSSQCDESGVLEEVKVLDTSDYRYFDSSESPVTHTANTTAPYLWETRTFRLIDSAWLFERTSLDASRVGEAVTVPVLKEICTSSTSGFLSGLCTVDSILGKDTILDTSSYRYFDPVPHAGLDVIPVVVTTTPTVNTFTAGIYALGENEWMFGRSSLDSSRVGDPVTLAMIQEICSSSTSGTLSSYCTGSGVLTQAQTTESSPSFRFFLPIPYVSATDPSPPPAAPPYPPLPTLTDESLQSAPQWLRDALSEPRAAMKQRHAPCCGEAETCSVAARTVSVPFASTYLSATLSLPPQSASDLRAEYLACCGKTDCAPRSSLTPSHTIAFVALADMEAGAVEVTFDEATQTTSVYNAALRVATVVEAVKAEADARGIETIALIPGDYEAEAYRSYAYNAQYGRNCSTAHNHVTFSTHAMLAMLGDLDTVVYSVGNHEFDVRGEQAVADQAVCMNKLGNVHMVSANVAYETLQPPLPRAHTTSHGTCVIGSVYQMQDNSIPMLELSQFADVQETVRDVVHGECASSARRLSLHHGQGPTDALDLTASVSGLGAIFVAGSSEESNVVTNPNGKPRFVRKTKSPTYDRKVTIGTLTFLGDHVVLDVTDVDLTSVADHAMQPLDERAMAVLGEKASDAFAEQTSSHLAFAVPVGHNDAFLSNVREQCTTGMHALGTRALLDGAIALGLHADDTIVLLGQSSTRASLDAGNITKAELLSVDAFSATMLCFDMRIDDLVTELDNEHIAIPSARGTAIASNGIRMTVDMSSSSTPVVASVTRVGGSTLYDRAATTQFPDASIRLPVCTGGFQAMNGADGYSVFKQYYDDGTHAISLSTPLSYYESLLHYVTANNPVRVASLGERVDMHINGDGTACKSRTF